MEVHNSEDVAENFLFRVVSQGVLKMSCIPTSNAEVERVFSQVNVVKTNKRSRMKTEMLDTILCCKLGLGKFGCNVDEFEPPKSILTYTSDIYKTNTETVL